MSIEYKTCPYCHQPSSVANEKCYACGATIPESPKQAKEPGLDALRSAITTGTQGEAASQARKRPARVLWGRLFLVIGMAMMLFFGFIFNSKLIYMNAFGQAVESISKDLPGAFRGQQLKRPSPDELGWFLDPGQLEENGMRLGMVFWMSGMLCILLPKQKAD